MLRITFLFTSLLFTTILFSQMMIVDRVLSFYSDHLPAGWVMRMDDRYIYFECHGSTGLTDAMNDLYRNDSIGFKMKYGYRNSQSRWQKRKTIATEKLWLLDQPLRELCYTQLEKIKNKQDEEDLLSVYRMVIMQPFARYSPHERLATPFCFAGKIFLHNSMENPYYYTWCDDKKGKKHRVKLTSLSDEQYRQLEKNDSSGWRIKGVLDVMQYKRRPGETEERMLYVLVVTFLQIIKQYPRLQEDKLYKQWSGNLPAGWTMNCDEAQTCLTIEREKEVLVLEQNQTGMAVVDKTTAEREERIGKAGKPVKLFYRFHLLRKEQQLAIIPGDIETEGFVLRKDSMNIPPAMYTSYLPASVAGEISVLRQLFFKPQQPGLSN